MAKPLLPFPIVENTRDYDIADPTRQESIGLWIGHYADEHYSAAEIATALNIPLDYVRGYMAAMHPHHLDADWRVYIPYVPPSSSPANTTTNGFDITDATQRRAIGSRISYYEEDRHWTPGQIAVALGISPDYVFGFYNGIHLHLDANWRVCEREEDADAEMRGAPKDIPAANDLDDLDTLLRSKNPGGAE